jgi:hypothetical protein
MEILFLLISIIITLLIVWIIDKSVYNSNKQILYAYKNSELLFLTHLILSIMMALVIFIMLCAFNNTFWHLPYLK